MKTHFYILLMLGMVFLLGCEDEKLGTDLGVTNVVLPDISEAEEYFQRTVGYYGVLRKVVVPWRILFIMS